MVVLAASICTKAGKPVISRQFREMPRSRIEGLLTSFPKLIPPNSQHTSVETPEVRFVYQPLEDLYILLITNKASNILQDIETLHLFARVVADLCKNGPPDEREISRIAFELLGAFDEIVSLGYREHVNLMQVRSVMEMESHEEKIQEIIARNKEAEAKEELKRRAKQLEMQRREQTRRNQGGSGGVGGGISGYASVPRYEAPVTDVMRSASPASSTPLRAPAFKGSGMKLGKKTKQADLMDAMGGELATPDVSMPTTPARAGSPPPKFTPNVNQESIHVAIREQLSITLNQSGGLKSLNLKGELNLLIADPAYTKIRLALADSVPQDDFGNDLQFKYHPKLFKGPDAEKGGLESEIKLKDSGTSWPVGQPLGVLRWKLATKDESFVPLTINCWPSPTGDGTVEVNIEYDLESDRLALHNVTISIPLPGGLPTVSSHTGSYNVDPSSGALLWNIPLVTSSDNKSGSLEFTIDGDDTSAFFPVKIDFAAEGSLVGVGIANVFKLEDNEEEMVFSQEVTCTTDEYLVV